MQVVDALDRARARREASRDSGLGAEDAALRSAREDSVAYLRSERALRDIALDPYWPKWSTPWWHMLLLHELG